MVLNFDSKTGRKTLLQQWLPDTSNTNQEPFFHSYIEEVFIVDGDLTDYPTKAKLDKRGLTRIGSPGWCTVLGGGELKAFA